MSKYQNKDERDIGWRTVEEAEGSGKSLVGAYLNYSGSSNPYKQYVEKWGSAYGRAVYEAWPADVDMFKFVADRIHEEGMV